MAKATDEEILAALVAFLKGHPDSSGFAINRGVREAGLKAANEAIDRVLHANEGVQFRTKDGKRNASLWSVLDDLSAGDGDRSGQVAQREGGPPVRAPVPGPPIREAGTGRTGGPAATRPLAEPDGLPGAVLEELQ